MAGGAAGSTSDWPTGYKNPLYACMAQMFGIKDVAGTQVGQYDDSSDAVVGETSVLIPGPGNIFNTSSVIGSMLNPGNNPYVNESAYDPDSPLGDQQTFLTTAYTSAVDIVNMDFDVAGQGTAEDTIDAAWKLVYGTVPIAGAEVLSEADLSTDVDTLITAAIAHADDASEGAITFAEDSIKGAALKAMRDNYGTLVFDEHARALNRFHAGMRDINGVMSSSFVQGDAILESSFTANGDKFTNDLQLSMFQQFTQQYLTTFMESFRSHLQAYVTNNELKNQLVAKSADVITSHLQIKLGMQMDAARIQHEVSKLEIDALRTQTETDVEIDRLFGMWDLDAIKEGMSVFSSPQGAQVIPNKASKSEKVLNSFGAAASAGAVAAGAFK